MFDHPEKETLTTGVVFASGTASTRVGKNDVGSYKEASACSKLLISAAVFWSRMTTTILHGTVLSTDWTRWKRRKRRRRERKEGEKVEKGQEEEEGGGGGGGGKRGGREYLN